MTVLHFNQNDSCVFDEVDVEMIPLRYGGVLTWSTVPPADSDVEGERFVVLGHKLRESEFLPT